MSNKIKLIKNGTLILPDKNEPIEGDIYLEDGIIKKINLETDSRKKEKTGGDGVIDAKGLLVFPGLIDMHVHLREPGREDEETIATGTAAAAAGGFTAVACMPNTLPPVDNQESVMFIKQLARDCPARVYPVGAISKGRAGKEICRDRRDGATWARWRFPMTDHRCMMPRIMRRALEYAGMFGIPVISHAEDSTLDRQWCDERRIRIDRLGMPGIPPYSEEVCISRDIILCKHIGTHLHIAHVSTKGSVELVRRAKAEGVHVTAEATPHHFTLTDTLIGKEFNTNLKMMPPLRTQEDVDAIIAGLMDGTIDAIASDHAPHSSEEKEVEFDQAPNGIIGLETTVGLVATYSGATRTSDLERCCPQACQLIRRAS